jgi:hypothetical protein
VPRVKDRREDRPEARQTSDAAAPRPSVGFPRSDRHRGCARARHFLRTGQVEPW